MSPRFHSLWIPPAIVLMAPAARAQDPAGFAPLAHRSLVEMNDGKWTEALATLDHVIATHGTGEPLLRIGPQFGTIWFRKGLCEMKLRRWEAATRSFEICYRDFPDPPGPKNGNSNTFQKRALLKWGEAAMGAGQWDVAVDQFRKFLDERDKVQDTYPAGAFHINVAICNYKLGRIPPGNLNLEIAISNKDNFPTPAEGIVAGFEALVESAIATKNERALLDFIRKNRGGLAFEPYEMGTFSSIYMKCGADAFAADMPAAALAIYQLVPSTESVIEDLQARIASLGPMAEIRDGTVLLSKQALQERLAATEAEFRGKDAVEIVKLQAAAAVHEQQGNLRGALAAYDQLVRDFPAASQREEYLFNAIRLGIAIGRPQPQIAEHTTLLATEFPESRHTPTARQLTLASLFQTARYAESGKLAAQMLGTLDDGSPGHDFCLHVLGASQYYLGQNADARTSLESHLAKYPSSPHARAAAYFHASNLVRLREWDAARPLLDAFLKTFPDAKTNPYLPFALYDRASCRFSLRETDAALADLDRIEKQFPHSSVLESAFILKGGILRALARRADAGKCYLKALELADARKNPAITAEALFHLVSLLGETAPKEAAAYADRFWNEAPEKSPLRDQLAVTQVKALAAVDRTGDALARLQETIARLAKTGRAYPLERAIHAYAGLFLTRHPIAELRKRFSEFPGIDPADQGTRALLRMALIAEYEKIAGNAKDLEAEKAARGEIMALFQELKSSLSPNELPTPILLKLADHLRNNTSAPREALPFYEEAISRREPAYRFPSLFGRGDTWTRSTSAEEQQKGIDDFDTIYRESKARTEREYALFRVIQARVAKGDHAQAIKDADLYNTPQFKFNRFEPEVGLCLARSLQETGDSDGAINAYSKVWSMTGAPVRLTALAMKSWMELLWNRDQPGDREVAARSGTRYLDATRPLTGDMTGDEASVWKEIEQLVQAYNQHPGVR